VVGAHLQGVLNVFNYFVDGFLRVGLEGGCCEVEGDLLLILIQVVVQPLQLLLAIFELRSVRCVHQLLEVGVSADRLAHEHFSFFAELLKFRVAREVDHDILYNLLSGTEFIHLQSRSSDVAAAVRTLGHEHELPLLNLVGPYLLSLGRVEAVS